MSQTVIRSVGSAAKYNTSRHSLGLYRCVINTAQYSISPPIEQLGELKSIVEIALATVVMQHGILRVGIANEDSQDPVFTYLKSIDLHEMIEWKRLPGDDPDTYTQGLIRSTEAQHDRLWEGLQRKPGWKLIVHQNNQHSNTEHVKLDISFAFHHAYADGQSAFIFHRDLLRALNSADSAPGELQDHVLHLKEPPTLPAGSEVIVPFTISWSYLLKLIWSDIVWMNLVPSWLKAKPNPATIPWTGNPINPEPHKANLRLIFVPQEVLASLLAACRKHRVTLTPLLQVLVLASVASRMPSDVAPAFDLSTAISLRRFTKPDMFDRENALHCLVTGHRYLADASAVAAFRASFLTTDQTEAAAEPLLWSTAAKIGASLHARVSTLPGDDVAGLTGMVSDWSERWVSQFGKKRDATWECSNAGSIKACDARGSGGGEQACWKIERSIFSQGATPVGPAFGLNVAGVEGQGLWMTVSWQETTVETSLMEGLVQDLQKWTDAFASTGRFGMFGGGDGKGR
ncbi:Alcohol acetyltransferase [Diatrype stigma]|uniref:Alcohol acetyltransferase n=1 Tax=Diatrype stigma TaxID=117547 RepID=A0AAN9UR31_9PEZI